MVPTLKCVSPPILLPLFERYANTNSFDGHLFNFYQRHSSSDSFSANVNIGIRKICQAMGLEKEQYYCVYTFRHTWGTVAQNRYLCTELKSNSYGNGIY